MQNQRREEEEHALHVCDVELDETFPHADHTGIQTNGPHQFWVCAAEGNPMMYGWDKAAISQWLEAKKVKFGSGQDKRYALERIVRHNRIKRGKEKEQEWSLQECAVAADKVINALGICESQARIYGRYRLPGAGKRRRRQCTVWRCTPIVPDVHNHQLCHECGACVQQFHYETTGNMDGAVAMIDHTFKVIVHTRPMFLSLITGYMPTLWC